MKVYFQNKYGEEKLLSEVDDEQQAYKLISKFLKDHNFKSYYTRTWMSGNRKMWDVGSHTEFFITEE